MASPNLKMRDWPLYRIRHAHHYRTGDAWCIYPLYDFAHCLSDLIEGITHSICTLEFENNRELYDWIVEAVTMGAESGAAPDSAPKPPRGAPSSQRPHQYEFARLEVTTVMTSKRKLLELVEKKHVTGWDDPRLATLAGLRRRGYTADAIRDFCERVGVARNNSTVEFALLEHVLREDLNLRSPRVLAVLRPLRVVIETWPEDRVDSLDASSWPADVGKEGSRVVPMGRVVYIDRDDFMEDPPRDYHRLAPGREVRLRHSYVIRCERVIKDPATGEIVEIRASHGPALDALKVKGTIQWVSAAHALPAEVRLYDRLFVTDAPGSTGDSGERAQPRLARHRARPGRAQPRRGEGRRSLPVRAAGLLLRRSHRLQGGRAGLQPHGGPQGHVGQDDAHRGRPDRAPSPAGEGQARCAPRAASRHAPRSGPRPKRCARSHGIPAEDARILAADPAVRAFFEEAVARHGATSSAKSVARWIVNEVLREAKGGIASLPFGGAAVGELVALVDAGTVSGTMAKEVFAAMLAGGGSPAAIIEARGLRQISDTGAIEAAVAAVLADNADAVARFRAGNANLLGALVGMVMKKTGGKANPKLVNELLRARLAGG